MNVSQNVPVRIRDFAKMSIVETGAPAVYAFRNRLKSKTSQWHRMPNRRADLEEKGEREMPYSSRGAGLSPPAEAELVFQEIRSG